jgi:hypothetical protein
VVRELDQNELIDRWTLVGDELELVSGKRSATRLGFALLLRFYTERGRFPRGRGELPDEAVEYVARQVKVTAADDILATDADKRGLTPLFWEHVLPYGEVKLNMAGRLTLGGAEPPAIPLGLSARALTAP